KFTNKGSVTVEIENNIEKKLIVAVKDTGIGISEAYLPKLFAPFSQEQQGLTRTYDGNGLGLALVKRLCEMNFISIEVTSIKSKETCFKMIFP
ncbi:MAG: ATP-binding protein, partial [Ignavibacteria bacterium]|nr:ATP-binding protein [Ignavibacteria bacterium]